MTVLLVCRGVGGSALSQVEEHRFLTICEDNLWCMRTSENTQDGAGLQAVSWDLSQGRSHDTSPSRIGSELLPIETPLCTPAAATAWEAELSTLLLL